MSFEVNLGSLNVQVEADTSDFEQGQKKVQKGIKKTDGELRKSVNSFGKWATAAALSAATVVAAFAKTQ